MDTIYSNTNDCLKLAKLLKNKMGNQIDFLGSANQEIISGKYFSHYRGPHSDISYLFNKGLPFYYKFCENGFLTITIGSYYPHENSIGEKLAVLSAFYEIISANYGEPTVFYTIKDDDEQAVTLHWSFINREEDIQKFQNGTYLDDDEIEKIIIIGEPKDQTNNNQLSDTTKKTISKELGLPFDLISLIEENSEDYLKYKTRQRLTIPKYAKIDGIPPKKLSKKRN